MKSYRRYNKNPFRKQGSKFAVPGLYHYKRSSLGAESRIHLRIDQDGSGLLLVNANRVMHLNASAALMTRLMLEEVSLFEGVQEIIRCYQVSPQEAQEDLTHIYSKISDFVLPNGGCPVHDLDLDIIQPFSKTPSAPYRMDLALTYRCNNDCPHCYNARPRNFPEMETDKWKLVLDRIWEVGIPHVIFTGGEPTLRSDLFELITHAENNGQITGLNTNGRRLQDMNYVDRLVNAGLDHVQITLESHDAAIHDQMVNAPGAWKQTIAGLQNVLDSPLFVMTNTTMLTWNSPKIEHTLNYLASLGVPTIGLNALIYAGRGEAVGTGLEESKLSPLLETARQVTGKNNQRLIWYTPTMYCNFDPMQLDLGVKSCTAASYNMCIEPDGGVIPCQSYYHQLGNFLSDAWDTIWNHDLAVALRARKPVPIKCNGCLLISECGGGCPLYRKNLP